MVSGVDGHGVHVFSGDGLSVIAFISTDPERRVLLREWHVLGTGHSGQAKAPASVSDQKSAHW